MLRGRMLCSCTVKKDIPYISLSMVSMVKSILHMHAVASRVCFTSWTGAMNTAWIIFGLIHISVHKGVVRVRGEIDILHS